jgi:ferredoxin-NADP reductase/Na+-transporting NADH:ubiquinone oxidoreductase subunit NqrB
MRESGGVIASLTAVRQRVLALLGALSMYRLVLFALIGLALIALVLSALGIIVSPTPGEIVVTFVVLAVVISAVDAAAQRVLRLPWRIESSLVTSLILLFVLRPGWEPAALAGIALAGVVASLSKYLIAWRGRHVFNPAAFGAAFVSVLGSFGAFEWLGTSSSWWVGTPSMAVPVALFGLLVLWRTEKIRVVVLFVVLAIGVAVIRQIIQGQQAGLDTDIGAALSFAALQTPFLFLGAFMLSEPLTLPPRRWQQFWVAAVVGILAGWPIPVADLFTLGQERALLIGNLLAFAFALRSSVRLTLETRSSITPTVQELTFRTRGRLRFRAGQYLELEVPHRRPDARGTRREFSIVSAPADLPTLRIAYRSGSQQHPSSYKRALAAAETGNDLAVTGTWGDFLLRDDDAPVLMVAAGIGVTPFVSQLRQLRATEQTRDIVLVYVASESAELAFREELAATGVRVLVFTRDEPRDLPAHWEWAQGVRLNAEGLERVVADLPARHAFVSGPPRLIADLAPALHRARSLTTDAFAGY